MLFKCFSVEYDGSEMKSSVVAPVTTYPLMGSVWY